MEKATKSKLIKFLFGALMLAVSIFAADRSGLINPILQKAEDKALEQVDKQP